MRRNSHVRFCNRGGINLRNNHQL
nr:50S ribosomal protein L14 [Smilax moranensis]